MTRPPQYVAVLLLAWVSAMLTASVAAATSLEGAQRLVVHIRSLTPSGEEEFGAGVVFAVAAPFLDVVTANHVVRLGLHEHEGLKVSFESWPGESFAAKVLDTRFHGLDLAVLRVDLRDATIPADRLPDPAATGRFIPSRELERGQKVFPIGHPQGHDWLVPGQPSALQSIGAIELEFDSACEAGHSGGGLFDEAWRLVGMLLKTDGTVCLAMPFEAVVAELEKSRYTVELRSAKPRSPPPGPPPPGPPPPLPPTETGRYPCEGTVVRPGVKLGEVRSIPARNASSRIAIMGGTSITIQRRCGGEGLVWYQIDYDSNDLATAWIRENFVQPGLFCPLKNPERIEKCR